MPKSWYIWKENVIKDDDDDETIAHKLLYQKVCAHKKPYFFQYNYSSLRSEYLSYVKQANENCASLFHKSLDLLLHSQDLTPDEQRFVQTYQNKMILDLSPSTMNRICWHIEKCFDGVIWPKVGTFDYTMLKSDNQYTLQDFALIKKLCKTYQSDCALVFKNDDDTDAAQLLKLLSEQINMVVSNQYIQCNILLDLCYQHGMPKQIVWELCGDVIVENLLHSHNNTLQYPKKDDSGEFFCCGHRFSMETLIYGGDEDEEF